MPAPAATFATPHGVQDPFVQAKEHYKNAVGLVLVTGAGKQRRAGTVWSISRDTFATNAHVVIHVKKLMQSLAKRKSARSAYIAINGSDRRFRVLKMWIHPNYRTSQAIYQGKAMFGLNHDVGWMRIEGVTRYISNGRPDLTSAVSPQA